MKKLFVLGCALALAGCSPMKVSVYGNSGKVYLAPDLCAAQIACEASGDAPCKYNTVLLIGSDGKPVPEMACAEAKK